VPQRSGIIIGAVCWYVLDVRVSFCALCWEYRLRTQETVTCPLAQSVERIHGKEKFGAIDQQEQPLGQVNADPSIWIEQQRVSATGTGWRPMLMSFRA
jgi:hypothetical protein